MLRRIWVKLVTEEHGSASPEWAFIATILVLGAITGMIVTKQIETSEHFAQPPAMQGEK